MNLLIVTATIFTLAFTLQARQLDDIYWNATNTMFSLDNNDHVISAQINDWVNVHCPRCDVNDGRHVNSMIIHRVDAHGYTHCQLSPKTSKPVGSCRCRLSSTHSTTMTVAFRAFTPLPNGLEYTLGESYYFISTSSGKSNGMHQRAGGLCQSKNMRVRIDIVDDSAPKTPRPTKETPFVHPSIKDRRKPAFRPRASVPPTATPDLFNWWKPDVPADDEIVENNEIAKEPAASLPPFMWPVNEVEKENENQVVQYQPYLRDESSRRIRVPSNEKTEREVDFADEPAIRYVIHEVDDLSSMVTSESRVSYFRPFSGSASTAVASVVLLLVAIVSVLYC